MLHSSSEKIATFFVSNNIIAQEDVPVYAYGIELILASVMNALTVLAIGLALGRVVETVLFLAAFAVLRSYAGGYHADTHLGCLLVLLGAYLFNMAMLYLIPAAFFLTISLIVAPLGGVLIFLFAPVASENKPLDENETKDYRIKSRIWCVLLAAISLAGQLIFPKLGIYFFTIMLGFLTATVSTATVFIQKRKTKGEFQ